MFKSVCIIGCGLIGSSILRNVKKKKLSKKVTVFDKSTSVRRYLKRKKLCNNVSTNLKKIQYRMKHLLYKYTKT